jgi:hypothetical protein
VTTLDPYLAKLRLGHLEGIEPRRSMAVDALVEQIRRDAKPDKGGRMLLGLAMSFVAVAEQVLATLHEESLDDALEQLDRVETYRSGRTKGQKANSLVFEVEEDDGAFKQVGLRGAYEGFLEVVRGDLRRYDYPSSAPHATQAWSAHVPELESIFAMSQGERRALAEGLWELALELPEHKRRTQPRSVPHPFVAVLEDFHSEKGSGEPTGAVLQGITYGFIRADAPTLSIATSRVRAGRRRAGGVGDIDGLDGPEVMLAAEVKDFEVTKTSDINGFLANLGEWPDAVAFVVCAGATREVIDVAGSSNVTVVTRSQMISAARLWTTDKQLMAVRSTLGYFVHIEQNDALITRFSSFLAERKIGLR